jgi:hypothetical protein
MCRVQALSFPLLHDRRTRFIKTIIDGLRRELPQNFFREEPLADAAGAE